MEGVLRSQVPGLTSSDSQFKNLVEGTTDAEVCHVDQFVVGELLPIKGAFWEVESCEGLTLILRYKGETKRSKRKVELDKKRKKRKKR